MQMEQLVVSVQLEQVLEPPLQTLVQMLGQLDYRHELPPPVLSDQANLVQHRRGCC
jgi:hypothetical protein